MFSFESGGTDGTLRLATSGIGFLMTQAREFLRTDIIVVGLVVYSLLGLATDLAVRLIERTALAWRPSFVAA